MLEDHQMAAWRRSTRCSSGGCVEVAKVGEGKDGKKYLVRDSKDPQSPELAFGSAAWQTFIEGVKNGELGRR
jgi:hypothetical protein